MINGIEFLLDGKRLINHKDDKWDVFISAYNDSARVRSIFQMVQADRKLWWILPEYGYSSQEIRHLSECIILPPGREDSVIKNGIAQLGLQTDVPLRICVDITGFMRPQILYLMALINENGSGQYEFIYTEPDQYKRKVDTSFSIGEDVRVESVAGYIGAHDTDMSEDVLVLGVGYDHHLISHTIQAKESASVVQIHSFPSLSADMYHESILRLDRVGLQKTNRAAAEVFFSSANDPFVTAAAISEAVETVKRHRRITNLYLCPLATKPQAVGFGLYYLRKLRNSNSSIIFPNSQNYSKETSTGVGRTWVYPIII